MGSPHDTHIPRLGADAAAASTRSMRGFRCGAHKQKSGDSIATQELTRRSFLKVSAAAGGLPFSPELCAAALQQVEATPEADQKRLPEVVLGRTGRTVPRLGFGGFPISRLQEKQGLEVVRHALHLGIRYIDTAPSYGSGRSERRIAAAISDAAIPREELFIATKTLRRDAAGARRELEESLERLGVEFVDVLQVHAVADDVERLFGEDAVLAGLERAREEGLIRHIGITGHRNPSHLIEALQRFDFMTALVPVNPLDTKHLSFVRDFLPVAAQHEVAVIGMKVFAGGSLLANDRLSAAELLRYALSQDGVPVVVPGCEKIEHLDEAYAACIDFREMSPEDQRDLEERVGEHEGRKSEWYKGE